MHIGRLLIAGAVASVLFVVLDAVFGVLGGILAKRVFGVSASQPDQSKMTLALVFDVINGFMLALVYAAVEPALAGSGMTQGLLYGLIVWALRVVMWAFSTYVMTSMSPVLIGINVVTGLVEVLVIGVVIAAIY